MIRPRSLDSIRRDAQATADREGKAVVILNLNQFSPMYVIRAPWDGCETAKGYVETVRPSGNNGNNGN